MPRRSISASVTAKSLSVVNQMIHVVDYYPTLANLAGAGLSKSKPLDGLDMWPTISNGEPASTVHDGGGA
jgi:arylsulfatase A-like enzyme